MTERCFGCGKTLVDPGDIWTAVDDVKGCGDCVERLWRAVEAASSLFLSGHHLLPDLARRERAMMRLMREEGCGPGPT